MPAGMRPPPGSALIRAISNGLNVNKAAMVTSTAQWAVTQRSSIAPAIVKHYEYELAASHGHGGPARSKSSHDIAARNQKKAINHGWKGLLRQWSPVGNSS